MCSTHGGEGQFEFLLPGEEGVGDILGSRILRDDDLETIDSLEQNVEIAVCELDTHRVTG